MAFTIVRISFINIKQFFTIKIITKRGCLSDKSLCGSYGSKFMVSDGKFCMNLHAQAISQWQKLKST